MATILVIGASQGIGLETVKAALAAGHTVRAFSRSAPKIAIDDPRLAKIAGDALNGADIRGALAGADAVVQAIGLPMSAELLTGTTLFSESTRVLVAAMTAMGPKRLVTVTGAGAGDSRGRLGLLYSLAFTAFLARAYNDKDVQERIIRSSPLDWTIVRPGILRDGPATRRARALVNPSEWRAGPVTRADVGAFLVREIETSEFLRKTPLLVE